jgi:hypothetical protein
MDEPPRQKSPIRLSARLVQLRNERRQRQGVQRQTPVRRRALSPAARALILAKTRARCHICGGPIAKSWEADHVLAHAGGGVHAADNFLAAHTLCNNYRWDYSPEEFQWVLKIGVWARKLMETESELGQRMLETFFAYDLARHKRRRRGGPSAPSNQRLQRTGTQTPLHGRARLGAGR